MECAECELELVDRPGHSVGPFHQVCPACGVCRDCVEGNV